MLSDKELKDALDKLTAPRVTEDYIRSRILDVQYTNHDTTTICIITLDNGFKVIGHSTPASEANLNKEIGRTYAYKNAFNQLWQLFGFLLVEGLFRKANQ